MKRKLGGAEFFSKKIGGEDFFTAGFENAKFYFSKKAIFENQKVIYIGPSDSRRFIESFS